MNVLARCNWDSTNIGPVSIEDDELARPHKVGLAREFGNSAAQKLDGYDPDFTLPGMGVDGDGRGRGILVSEGVASLRNSAAGGFPAGRWSPCTISGVLTGVSPLLLYVHSESARNRTLGR